MTRKQRIILIISLCLYGLILALMYVWKGSEASLNAMSTEKSQESHTNATSADQPQAANSKAATQNAVSTDNTQAPHPSASSTHGPDTNTLNTENTQASNASVSNAESTQAMNTNAVGINPQASVANAQQFLTYLSQHIAEGTLGGNIPLLLTKEELAATYRVKEADYTSSTSNSSYFERDGYRYFLYHQNGQEKLLVIGAQFHALTKEQILSTFGAQPYIDSTINHQIVYNIGAYIVLFAHTDPQNRESYNLISLSPVPAT